MRWSLGITWAAAVLGIASRAQAADSKVYHDAETGFTFTQFAAEYLIGSSIIYRIALPEPVNVTNYDVVLQVVAPKDVGWAGLAWGGTMLDCPLTVAWANGQTLMISSRYASQHALPPTFSGAAYTILKTGTHVNSTHWQFTAKCTGCTYFSNGGSGSSKTQLSPTGVNHLAWAAATAGAKPPNPSSNTSSLNVHDVYNYWGHDFSQAGNTNFGSLVTKDAGK
ncbi:iron reductase domain protein [Stipitochalara longipes BDJ]|nr:iron reductase domain protein [Stipitochalara longipes BDJ]